MITQKQIEQTQEKWKNALLNIRKAYVCNLDYRKIAQNEIYQLYALKSKTIMFKPTMAIEKPFRFSEEEVLSYFVGGMYASDHGFALQPIVNILFNNMYVASENDLGFCTGIYTFCLEDGSSYDATYTFGFCNEEKEVKIFLHHSSLPPQI